MSVRLRIRALATLTVVGLLLGLLVGVGTSATAGQRADWSTRAVPPPAPGHVDPAPPGVDVRRHLRTDELHAKARARTERRLAQLGRGSGRRGGPVVAAAAPLPAEAGAPAGLSALPGLAGHVAPSCSGTGADGNRVQVLYAVESDDPDRYDAVLPILRQEIANVDDTFALSAAKDGGGLRVRWVFDPATCAPVVGKVRVGKGELASFASMITAVQRAGWNRADRKYLVFADAAVLCGVGHLFLDDRASGNANDGGSAMYSRIDTGCWQATSRGSTAAHELMHNLGGIQGSAGHATPYGHCTDDNDLMCYVDGSGVAMRQICPAEQEPLFDCRGDDYFATRPAAGSYLATRWNTARSSFLDAVPPLPEADDPPDGGGTALTVAVAGPTSVRPGEPAALAASGSDEGAYVWVVDRPHCVVGPTTGATLTVQCPTYETGSVRATVVLTDSGGRTATDTHDVALTGPTAPLPLTLTRSATTRYVGQAVRVTARVGSATAPVRGWVQMWSSTDGRNWTTIAGPGDTGPDGLLSVTARPRRTTYYQAAVAVSGSGGWVRPGHVIEDVRVTRWPVRLGASARAGRPDRLKARLTNRATGSPMAGRKVVLQKRFPGRSWRSIRTVTTGTRGYVKARVQPRRVAYYRWVFRGSPTYRRGVSNAVRLRY